VDGKFRGDLLNELSDANVLNNDRIDFGLVNCLDRFTGGIDFVIEHKRVEGDEAFDAATMKRPHDFG